MRHNVCILNTLMWVRLHHLTHSISVCSSGVIKCWKNWLVFMRSRMTVCSDVFREMGAIWESGICIQAIILTWYKNQSGNEWCSEARIFILWWKSLSAGIWQLSDTVVTHCYLSKFGKRRFWFEQGKFGGSTTIHNCPQEFWASYYIAIFITCMYLLLHTASCRGFGILDPV